MKMKRYKSTKLQSVTAASNVGTTYYRATLGTVVQTLARNDANLFLLYLIEEYGFDALDFKKHMFGSAVVEENNEDVIYICVTDGYEIEVDGEMVDPEEALENYAPIYLENHIQDANDDVIMRNITPYELADFDESSVARGILRTYDVSFKKVVSDFEEIENTKR